MLCGTLLESESAAPLTSIVAPLPQRANCSAAGSVHVASAKPVITQVCGELSIEMCWPIW